MQQIVCMKKVFLPVALSFAWLLSSAQLTVKVKCGDFVVDILDGKVNDVHPDFTTAQIKAKLPCVTSEDPSTSACGGALIYKAQDVKFFPARNYVEIGPNFKGRMTVPTMSMCTMGLRLTRPCERAVSSPHLEAIQA